MEYIFLISAYILNIMALIGMVNTGLKTNNHLVWIFSIILMGLSAYIKYQKEKPIFKAIKYMNLGLIFTFFIGNALIGFDSFNISSFFFNCFLLSLCISFILILWYLLKRFN